MSHPDVYLCNGHIGVRCLSCSRYEPIPKDGKYYMRPHVTYKYGCHICHDYIPRDNIKTDQGEVRLNLEDKAREIIDGDREQTHGDPAKNLRVIAGLWSSYLGVEVKATDVCNLMELLKIARLKNNPFHEDSLVDLKGYAILHEKILKCGPSDEKPKSDMLRPYDAFCPATTDSINNKKN